MSISISDYPIYLPNIFKFVNREYLGKLESQKAEQKLFHRDTLEISLGHIPEIPIKEIEEFRNRF